MAKTGHSTAIDCVQSPADSLTDTCCPEGCSMPDSSTLAIFTVAALALLLIPGPSVLYIVARGIAQGRRAGFVSVLAIEVGNLVHVTAAALGLSALVLSSAVAFSVVKYAGAAYLIYLGLRTLLARDESAEAAMAPSPQRARRIFVQGVIVSALNPKTALFFLAFLPQFVDPARGSVAAQALVLGCLFVGLGFVTDGCYALASGSLGGVLRGNLRLLRLQRRFAGTVYLGLGLSAAFADGRVEE
jgi:threonine/homoserine/homoserine lactone efflux protein